MSQLSVLELVGTRSLPPHASVNRVPRPNHRQVTEAPCLCKCKVTKSCAVCGALAHGSCSGMTKAQRSRETYTCGRCGGPERTDECLVCSAAIRSNSRRTVCTVCRRGAHAACTGLTREQIRREEAYVCEECGAASGEDGQRLEWQQAPAVQTEEKARCGVCGGYLRRSAECPCVSR